MNFQESESMAELYEVHGLVRRLAKDAIIELFRKLSVGESKFMP